MPGCSAPVGGFFTDGQGWRWCFYINLPIGIAATLVILTQLPAGGGSGGRLKNVDFMGAALLSSATIALLLALEWGRDRYGWGSIQTIGLLGTAVMLTSLFLWQESRHPQAIIPLSLFRNVPFTQSILITLCAASCIFTTGQFLPTYVQISLGGSATQSGLVIMLQGIGVFLSSLVTGQLIPRTGRFKYQMIVGAAWLTFITFFAKSLTADEAPWQVALLMGGMGLGAGLVIPVTQVIAQGSVSQAQQGVAASTRQFFLQIANVLGVALFSVVLSTSYASGFTASTADVRDRIPPAAYEEFKDPTLARNRENLARVSAAVRAVDGGEELLTHAIRAQREGMARAIDNIFMASWIAAMLILAITIWLREFPLRRSFDAPAAEAAGG